MVKKRSRCPSAAEIIRLCRGDDEIRPQVESLAAAYHVSFEQMAINVFTRGIESEYERIVEKHDHLRRLQS